MKFTVQVKLAVAQGDSDLRVPAACALQIEADSMGNAVLALQKVLQKLVSESRER